METRPEQYRQKAEEAEQQAQKTTDPKARQMFKEIADGWRQMAAIAERNKW